MSGAVLPGLAPLVDQVSLGSADALLAGGKVTAPGVGGAICTLAAPPAGKYLIGFRLDLSATDAGNGELRAGATPLMPGLGGFGSAWCWIVRTLDGATALSINATAIGTGGVIYGASISATRLQ